jgi:hypothetical protein
LKKDEEKPGSRTDGDEDLEKGSFGSPVADTTEERRMSAELEGMMRKEGRTLRRRMVPILQASCRE